MRDIRLTLNISSHLLNARQAEKINRFKKSSSQSVKGISSTYALKSKRQKLVFGMCKKCHFLGLFYVLKIYTFGAIVMLSLVNFA